LAFTKSTVATNNISALANKPVESAPTLKQKFDQYGIDDKTRFNLLVDELEATTGTSGAENIGSKTISGVSGNTVHAQLTDLKQQNTDTVKVAGNQTVGGIKTFTDSPVVPTPSSGTQATPKQYVDDENAKDVHLVGAQTVAGVKTFSSPPVVPTPLSNGEVANLNKGGERGSVYSEETDAMSCLSATDYKQPKQIQIGTWRTHEDGRGFRPTEDNNCPTIPARAREDGSGQPVIKIGAIRGRNPQNPLSRVSGLPTEQMLEINENGTSNALTTVQKDNVVVIPANNSKGYDIAEEEEEDSINFSNPNSETRRGRVGHGVAQTLDTACNQGVLVKSKEEYAGIAVHPLSKKLEFTGFKDGNSPALLATDYKAPKCIQFNTQRIRRLTPKECFSLMDFNEDFKWDVSDSQAYKQAGNSIVVSCLVEIIKKLNLT